MLWFFVVWHPPITPTNPFKSEKGNEEEEEEEEEEGPIVTIFTLGQNNPLDITNTCAHIYTHKAIESQITMAITDLGFPHKELPIGSLRFLHTKNCPSGFWGFFFAYKELPIRLLRVFFGLQRIAHQTFEGFFLCTKNCPSDFWGVFFVYKELPIRLFRVLHTKNYPSDIWGNPALDESPRRG
jgi:hypothetical protein